MQTRTYYHVVITTHNGRIYENPLQANELHLLSKILAENASATVSKHKCSLSHYEYLFGQQI